jgi:hypothetical protein
LLSVTLYAVVPLRSRRAVRKRLGFSTLASYSDAFPYLSSINEGTHLPLTGRFLHDLHSIFFLILNLSIILMFVMGQGSLTETARSSNRLASFVELGSAAIDGSVLFNKVIPCFKVVLIARVSPWDT